MHSYYFSFFSILFGMAMDVDLKHREVFRNTDMEELSAEISDWAEEFIASNSDDDTESYFNRKFAIWWDNHCLSDEEDAIINGFRCKCGCHTFFAHQLVRMDVKVDGFGDFIENASGDFKTLDIYDAEPPYGPFTCIECGEEYDELQ